MKPTETLGEESPVVWNKNEFSLFIIPWLCSVSGSVWRKTTHVSCRVMKRCLIRQVPLCHLKLTVWQIIFLKPSYELQEKTANWHTLSCVNQSPLCLLSLTSKDVCFVLSALFCHHFFTSCPHTIPFLLSPQLPHLSPSFLLASNHVLHCTLTITYFVSPPSTGMIWTTTLHQSSCSQRRTDALHR